MKKLSILFAFASILFAASCAKEVRVDNPKGEAVDSIHITIVASEKPEPITAAGTRTFVDESAIKWSNSGEKVKVWEVATPSAGEAVTTAATSADGVTTNSGAKITFGISMEDKSGGSYDSFDYYAVYPSSAYQTGSVVTNIALNTAAAQTPSATSFDASRDLLIGKKVENGGSQASTLNMQFARMVAIGKMTVKNLGSSEDITKITFSAKVGAEDVVLAGRTAFNLETGLPVTTYGSNTADHSIILNYEGQGIKANTAAGMVAYFTCYPFAINSETPGSFKVVVETATQSFTKEVTVNSVKGLVFRTGKASVFSVDMDSIAGEDKDADLCYAYLVPSDVSLTASYGNASVKKSHGDKWSMYATSVSGSIGVRRNDDGSNDSYIKLPDFVEDIKTVVVTLNSPSSGKTITLESSATGTEGAIAELATTAANVYTFDLTSGPSVKTAYFRSSGAQAKVDKIEVYAGDDIRSTLATPESVTAVRNTSDPKVTNRIDVSWGSVTNATGYIVTFSPVSGDAVVVEANTNSCSGVDLQYDMNYSISVVAVADPYVYKESLAGTVAAPVSTGSEPAGASKVDIINAAFTTVSVTTYTDWSGKSGSASDAVYAGKTSTTSGAIQMRTSSGGAGIVSTTSGGYIKSVTITTTTAYAKTIDVYGNNTAYTGYSDLFNDSKKGTKVGSVVATTSNTVTEKITFTSNYQYVGIRSNDGAVQASEIKIEWSSDPIPEKLATPVITPGTGTYYKSQSVTISAAGGATIYYTIDGTTPNTSSSVYSSPIAVSSATTIKAYAVKASYEDSDVATAVLDFGSPEKLGTPANLTCSGQSSSSLTFTWDAVANANGYIVSTDGGLSWSSKIGSNTYTWSGLAASTTYTLKVKANASDDGHYTESDAASASGTTSAGGSTPDPIVLNADTDGMPAAYGNANAFDDATLEGYAFKIQQVYATGGKLQWRASGNKNGTGTMYNADAMPAGITSIVIVYNSSDANKNHTVKIGSSANPTSSTTITPSTSGSTYTFAGDGSSKYFVITNGANAGYIDSITINFD